MASAGDQIAPFLVEAELGRGGMGVVYRARDLELAVHIADGEGVRDFSAFPDGATAGC